MGALRSLSVLTLAGVPLVFAATATVTTTARADGGNAAIAEGLFNDAKRLLDEGKADLACPKFAESLRLDATLGTRLNLAHCYEVAGKTASAWGEYKEVVRLGASDPKRSKIAKERVIALEPILAHATLTGAADVGVKIKLDGKPLDAAVLGTTFAIDAGDHTLALEAPGKQPRKVTFHVTDAQSSNVELPTLEDEKPATPDAPKVPEAPKPDEKPHDEVSQGKRIGGWAAIGGGIAVFGVGTAFGIATLALAGDVSSACPTGPCPNQSAIDKNSAAHTDAILSDIFIPVGLVAVGLGIYFVATSTHRVTPDLGRLHVTPTMGAHGGGLSLEGRF